MRTVLAAPVALVMAALLLASAGCTGSSVQNDLIQLKERVGRLEQELATLRASLDALSQELRGAKVTIYLKAPGEDLLVPVTRPVPPGEDPPTAALRALVAGPQAGEGAEAVLPAAVKVLSVQQKEGTATADFSGDITRMNVGSLGEALAVAAIVNTLTEFPQIRQVQILVEGKQVESLAGHVDVSHPVTRNEKLIKR
ncbi:MAG: GerMN domain-containing protein [Bacillota bacterium]|nr:GerMN domain-containing protein [Bacillota bacterium]